jgi:hypothetical protein
MDTAGYTRLVRYNGMEWNAEDVDINVFVNEALIMHYPDLRSCLIEETVDHDRQQIIFNVSKRAGEKGCQ